MARRIAMGIVLLALVALGVSIWRFNAARDAGPPLSGEVRAGFLKSAVDGCVALQKASPDNASVPPATITAYCECYADAMASRVTAGDLDRLRGKQPADMQAEMRPKMEQAEQSCMAKIDAAK